MKNLLGGFVHIIKCTFLGVIVSFLIWFSFLSITSNPSYGDTIGGNNANTEGKIIDSGKYYYYQGNKIYLQREENKFAVSFTDPENTKSTLTQVLDGKFKVIDNVPNPIHFDIAKIKYNGSHAESEVRSALKNLPNLKSLSDVYIWKDGTEFITTNRFVFHPNDYISDEAMQKFNKSENAKFIRDINGNKFYLMEIPWNNEKDITTVANEYVENGIASWATPDFISFVSLTDASSNASAQAQWENLINSMIKTLGLEGDIPTSATYQNSIIRNMLIKDVIRYVTNQLSTFMKQEPTFGQAYLQAFMNDPVISPMLLSFSTTTDQAGEYAPVQPSVAALLQSILREARSISIPQGPSKFADPSMQQGLVDYVQSHQSMLATIFGAKIFGQPNNAPQSDVTPNDPYFSNQWYLNKISAPSAWDLVFGNTTTYTIVATPVIAIVDTGVDLNHEDLQAKLVSGYDAVDSSGGAADCGNYWDPNDENGHGTCVAGIAAASTDNNIGIGGTAWNAKIMPVRIAKFTPSCEPNNCFVSDSEIATAIAHAVNNGAWIVNGSWYVSPPNDTLTYEISNASTTGRGGLGCVFVFSSGNHFNPGDPASIVYPASLANSYSGVIAVGATQKDDTIWGYSLAGPGLTLVAPSSDGLTDGIWTTDESGSCGYNPAGDYNSSFGGTSAAAPQVSGVAALILSLNPNLTSAQVKQILENSADKVAGMGGSNYTTTYGYGRLNALRAVDQTFGTGSSSISIGYNAATFSVVEPPDKKTGAVYSITNNGNGPSEIWTTESTNSNIAWYYPDFTFIIIAPGMPTTSFSALFDATVDGLASTTTEFKDSGVLKIYDLTSNPSGQEQTIPGNIDINPNAACSGCCCSMEPGVGIGSLYSSLYPLLLILGAWILLKKKQKEEG